MELELHMRRVCSTHLKPWIEHLESIIGDCHKYVRLPILSSVCAVGAVRGVDSRKVLRGVSDVFGLQDGDLIKVIQENPRSVESCPAGAQSTSKGLSRSLMRVRAP
jgi:hypothetical protein